jgi:hypothetical protein
VGSGPENHTLGGLKTPNFVVRCPIKAKKVAKQSPPLVDMSILSNAYLPVFALNPPSDVIQSLGQPITKVFTVS